MDFDNLLLEILDGFIEGKKVDVEAYCEKYPEHRDAILSKFKTAEFLKRNFHEDDFNGKQLGEYIIFQELGRGGMGIVFLGIQPALSRLSAIKILSPGFSQDHEAIKNFQEEAKTIAKFSHPNIVPIYSINDEKGMRYIAMGYISGRSLKNIIETLRTNNQAEKLKAASVREILQEPLAKNHDISQKNITLKRDIKFWNKSYFQFVATIGAEIADALSYAHQSGIIHGDLKPSNILLTNEAIPMVADFGLSRNIKELASSKNNEFAGTLVYAAPEQIKENILNEKTDIWSLGVTLYELLAFKNPFTDKTIKKTADKILKGNLVPLRTCNKKIPAEMEAIVLKCLELNPKNRYETLSELSQDLNNYLASRPIKAKPMGAIGRVGKWVRRQPILASFVTGFFLSIVIVSIFAYFLKVEALVDSGIKLHSSGSFEKAEKTYKEALTLSLKVPFTKAARVKIFHCLGDLYSRPGSSKESLGKALEYYNQSLEIDPNNRGALNSAASLYEDFGNYTEAFKYHKRLLDICKPPLCGLPIWHYAGLLRRLGRTKEALEFLGNHYKDAGEDPLVKGEIGNTLDDLIKSSANKLVPITTYDQVRQILMKHGFDEKYVESFIESYRRTHPWFDV